MKANIIIPKIKYLIEGKTTCATVCSIYSSNENVHSSPRDSISLFFPLPADRISQRHLCRASPITLFPLMTNLQLATNKFADKKRDGAVKLGLEAALPHELYTGSTHSCPRCLLTMYVRVFPIVPYTVNRGGGQRYVIPLFAIVPSVKT